LQFFGRKRARSARSIIWEMKRSATFASFLYFVMAALVSIGWVFDAFRSWVVLDNTDMAVEKFPLTSGMPIR